MNLTSHIVQRILKLDPPATRDLLVQRGLRVPMPDGAELLADRWAPRTTAAPLPTALIRGPYGRRGIYGALLARPLAERGYQVVIQSVRGTFGSGGDFDPMRQERDDGLATLAWVREQPWFGDAIVLFGLSYLGYTQWAVADQLPTEVKALIPHLTESAATLELLRKDGLSLETPFGWGAMVARQERRFGSVQPLVQDRRHRRALSVLPLSRADTAAAGHPVNYIQDFLIHDAEDPRWAGIDHSHRVSQVSVPVSSVAGWYDIFLPGQLRDFRILQDAGRPARLTVGPWTHLDLDGTAVREAVDFGLAYARGSQPVPRAPVRLYVMGADTWRDFDTWPPQGYSPQRWHLHADGALSDQTSGESAPDRYRYDPADPTPGVGGVRMTLRGAGRVDNTELEARPDVLTYTSTTLTDDVEVIGDVTAEIWFRSSRPFADVFVRLCDVDPAGRSVNVCDGLTRFGEAGRVVVEMGPAGHRFRPGHRIRLQVSGGAHPRFLRNYGTGEPPGPATTMVPTETTIRHTSSLVLPVV